MPDGGLRVRTGAGDLIERAPVTYQVINGASQKVVSGYFIRDGAVRVKLAAYDHARPLTIDPQQLVYSSYLGGSGSEQGFGVAIDSSGNAYVSGLTLSADFPATTGAYKTSCPTVPSGTVTGCSTGFVAKLDPFASGAAALVYATYLGGSGGDQANGIKVEGSGNAYVIGSTQSIDFPTTANALKRKCIPPATPSTSGTSSSFSTSFTQCPSTFSFLTKLNSSGSKLLYSTYLGGRNGGNQAQALAIDSSGDAYVAGQTESKNFPATAQAFQKKCRSAESFSSGNECIGSGFVTKINPAKSGGSSLVYSTYLGGKAGGDEAFGIAVTGSGKVWVTGQAGSADFPHTGGAFQKKCPGSSSSSESSGSFGTDVAAKGEKTGGGGTSGTGTGGGTGGTGGSRTSTSSIPSSCNAAFITELDPSQSGSASLIYSTFLGGGGGDEGFGIATDASGKAYVAGLTNSANFPTTLGAYATSCASAVSGCSAGFVAKINPGARGKKSLVYATFLGGSAPDQARAIAVDHSDNVYVTGLATSTDFPTTSGAYATTCPSAESGCSAGFLTEFALSKTGSSLLYSTYLGGSSEDEGFAIAVDGDGDAYLAGQTGSIDFPSTNGAFQTACPSTSGTSGCTRRSSPSSQLFREFCRRRANSPSRSSRVAGPRGSKVTIKNSGKGLLVGTVGAIQGQNSAFSITAGSGPFALKAGKTKAVTIKFAPQTSHTSFNDAFTISVTQTTASPPSPASVTVSLIGSSR